MSHLYVRRKNQYGADAIEPLVVATTVYPPGSYVKLTDDSIALVVHTNEQERMRPVVTLYEQGISSDQAAILDLSKDSDFSIQESLDPNTLDPQVHKCLTPNETNGYAVAQFFTNFTPTTGLKIF